MRYRAMQVDGVRGCRTLELMVADTLFERMRGLLAHPPLAPGVAMVLPSCRLIHTFGMRYPVDAVYLDRHGAVLKVTVALPPYRIDGHVCARDVLEMAAGTSACWDIVPGVRLALHGTGERAGEGT